MSRFYGNLCAKQNDEWIVGKDIKIQKYKRLDFHGNLEFENLSSESDKDNHRKKDFMLNLFSMCKNVNVYLKI